ncbi:MAG: bifunctional phosphoglucose/phosphomannose isomerase [Gemmatimonadota bacterium]
MTLTPPTPDERDAWSQRTAALDPRDMRGHIRDLPQQLAEAVERAVPFAAGLPQRPPSAIAVLGLGGSAMGADLAAAYSTDRREVPVVTVRDYWLPAWLGERALVIASSYSGNTEETLSGYQAAKARGLRAIALTTGGRLAELARTAGDPVLTLPAGLPPRAALGHSFAAVALSIAQADPGLALEREADALRGAAAFLAPLAETWLGWGADNPALAIAASARTLLPVIYGGHPITIAAARRWKTQINENGKIPAFTGEFSEHNHNEIVGFEGDHPAAAGFALISLETVWDHPQISRRFDFVRRYCAARVGAQHRVQAAGATPLEAMLWLCYLGDCASFLISIMTGQDPTPVTSIDQLKAELKDAE